jgi:hypothetical protein
MHTDRYHLGYARPMTELAARPCAAVGARKSASSALHSSCFAIRASTAPAWISSARWQRVSKRTLYQHFAGKDELIVDSIPTSCPRCSTAPTSHPRATPRRLRHPRAPVSVHRGGRRDPEPGPSSAPTRPRLQEDLRGAAHRSGPRGRRRRPRAARRATGAAPGWRLGPQPCPRQRRLRHRRRHRSRPHRQRHPHGSGASRRRRDLSAGTGPRAGCGGELS